MYSQEVTLSCYFCDTFMAIVAILYDHLALKDQIIGSCVICGEKGLFLNLFMVQKALSHLPMFLVEDRPIRHGVTQGPEGAVAAAVVVLDKVSGCYFCLLCYTFSLKN